MATKRCKIPQTVITDTNNLRHCNYPACASVYIDGAGWVPICDHHLRIRLDELGPDVVRAL